MLNQLVGNYKSIIIAKAKDRKIREKSSSGGVVTSVLLDLLKKKKIKGSLVEDMRKDEPWQYDVKIVKTKEGILSAAGSKYVKIPLNEYIEKINSAKTDIAVVGVPCLISLIRNLQKKGKLKNVKYLIGLFCGYNMSPEATEFLIKKLGIDKDKIKELRYRGGKYPGGFYVLMNDGSEIKLPKHYYDFINLMFVPSACLNCKDYMNEEADISVGDSWGYDNSSVVIVRTKKGEDMIKTNNIDSFTISEETLLKMHMHNIKHKKEGDGIALTMIRKLLKKFGGFFPLKLLGGMAKIRRKIIEIKNGKN